MIEPSITRGSAVVTRRELFPLFAGASGLAAAGAAGAAVKASEPQLRRVSYHSARTGKERDYFVYLPPGHANGQSWPVMLFLHGNGERGDGKGELDYVLAHGPLFEAWCQKRDLPFIIISPQLPMFGMGEVDYIKNRTPAQIPKRMAAGINTPPDVRIARSTEPMQGKLADDKLPDGPTGPRDGWNEIEDEVMAMVDSTVADFRGDAKRVYLTGLSYGGFGAWYLAAKHPRRFAALAPVVGYGHPDHAGPIATAKLPVWCFAGGRDPVVQPRFFYAVLNALERAGAEDVRFTNHEDMGHLAWVRIYAGRDLYDWFLTKSR
jgi:predicted peptidase